MSNHKRTTYNEQRTTNILVTGCKGQLGSELREETHNYASLQNKKFFWTDIDELDIRSFEKAEEFVTGNKIDCIINCAAYTAVDKAESEPELAAEINARAVSNLARISKKHNIFLIHVSTDYVFDGSNSKPYLETDKTNPVSAYGKTKLQGEEAVMANASSAIIIRTSWLYSSFGHNFVKTILRVAREKGKLNVVNDQVGNPTYARDLAKAIIEIVSSFRFQVSGLNNSKPESGVEIYNYSNEGVCTWYDFAGAIVEIRNIACEITPIETKDYPTPAKRPHYSVLNTEKIKKQFNIHIPFWKDSLKDCLKLIE